MERAVEDVAIHVALDAGELAAVGVLPEGPGAFVGKFFNVIMRYPIGVGVELRGVEVLHLELVARIEDGLDTRAGSFSSV